MSNILIDHCDRGYRNAQDTIRAIDTKTSILLALSAFSFTAILGIAKTIWDYAVDNPCSIEKILAVSGGWPLATLILAMATMVLSLLLGALCIWLCLATLTARGPHYEDHLPATILFPYSDISGSCKSKKAIRKLARVRRYYNRIRTAAFHEKDILSEYQNQIINIAGIVGAKIKWNRAAVKYFEWQVLTIPVLVILLACLALDCI